jgi:hypothetical protein
MHTPTLRTLPRLFLSASLLGAAACDQPTPPTPTASSAGTVTPRPLASATSSPSAAPAGNASASPVVEGPRFTTTTALSGGKSMNFRLFLERKGDEVEGFLYCDTAGQATRLRGKMLDERRFRAEEPGKKGKTRGVLEGELEGQTVKVASWFDGKKKNSKLRPARLAPFDAKENNADIGYRGAIGDKLRIRAQLKRDGKQLTGFYRYARSRDDLKLKGSVDLDSGKFDLQETSAAGTATGRLQGTFLRSGFLVGTWSSADGARTLPFYLENSKPLAQITELPGGVKVIPREEEKQPAPRCSVSSSYPELDGIKDKKNQEALNKQLRKEGTASIDPKECQEAEADLPYLDETSYTLTSTKKKGYLGVSFSGYSYRGGAHGMGYVACKVIDLERGELTTLSKLLNEDALPKLSKLVNEALRREHKTDQLSEAGFFEDEVKVSESTNLCLLDDKLEVVFGSYEVAPYAMGMPSVELPLSSVAPLFKKTPLTEAVLKLPPLARTRSRTQIHPIPTVPRRRNAPPCPVRPPVRNAPMPPVRNAAAGAGPRACPLLRVHPPSFPAPRGWMTFTTPGWMTFTTPGMDDVHDPGMDDVHDPGMNDVHDPGMDDVHDPGDG